MFGVKNTTLRNSALDFGFWTLLKCKLNLKIMEFRVEERVMFSLQDLLGQQQGSQAVDQISSQIGADHSSVNSAIQMALPMIVSAMANKAQQPEVQQEIVQNDGGILDNLGGFLGNSNQATNMGSNILGMLLGRGQQNQAAQQISQHSGLNMGQVASLLMMLAPIVMAYFGKQQTQQGLDTGGITDMLQTQGQQAQQSSMGGILGNLLDRDGDGSSMDDLAGLAMNYLTGR
jgi:hypothetical protein